MPTLLLHYMSLVIDEPVETITFLLSLAGDEALAFYAVTSGLTSHPLPEDLVAFFEWIEQCIGASTQLCARVYDLHVRMEEIAASHDPLAQFEQLVGYAVQEAYDQPCLVAPA